MDSDLSMSREQTFQLARRMIRSLRNGLARAVHYLKALGIEAAEAAKALVGAEGFRE